MVPDLEACGSESEEEGLSEGESGSGIDGVEGEGGSGMEEVRSKKSKIEGLYKPPTHDELQALKETQNLFNSNLMRLQVKLFCQECLLAVCTSSDPFLQITELLEEVKPKKNTPSHHKLEELLHKLRKILLALPSSPQVDVIYKFKVCIILMSVFCDYSCVKGWACSLLRSSILSQSHQRT